MNNRVIPISLAVIDREQRDRLEKMIAANPMVRLVGDDAEEMGVLIYEPGDSVEEDMPHIIHALESGQAEDVYLAGDVADPEILIRAMRSGIREYLKFPVEENDLRAAVMRTAMRLSLTVDDTDKGRILTVLGCKSGVGTTTLAVNLACALNEREPGRTVLLDLHAPMGEIPYFLDLKYDYTWGDLVADISRLDATYLRSVIAEHESGLHVLPAPGAGERPDDHTLVLILEQLRQSYDFVVVDAATPDEDELPKEVELADSILMAMQLSLPCLARVTRLTESLAGQDPDADRRLRLVANRVVRNGSIGVPEAAEVLGREIAWTLPEDGETVLSALNQGTPVVQAFPKSAAAKGVQALLKGLAPREKKAHKKLSLPFSSFFRKKGKNSDTNDNLAGAAL
ncbi:response regulator receiver protein [Pseudodesulfovibrio mercurii]|uniref:Response regulator receiver protein n=1 Tax=Pseudodesulfovibrio mercurii TaxID=641491 RepID=F0JJR0_9BACT|nr:histidine kinase [Pseudodesulfovibrio mercurii]EGB16159.1 response regulator receiver protein [Pseudodesulfovibrio mercurii]